MVVNYNVKYETLWTLMYCYVKNPLAFLFFFPLINFIYLFIYGCIRSLLLCAGFLQLRRAGSTLALPRTGFSLWWLLLLWSTGSRRVGFSSCGMRAQQLWCTGLIAPRHVGSSWTRARTRVPCIGRWILNHCTTGVAPTGLS